MAEKPNILIGVPAYRAQWSTWTAISLCRTAAALAQQGIGLDILSPDIGDIERARNVLASRTLHERKHTHLLMSDDDLAFHPNAVLKLVRAKRDVIACVCPLRRGLDKLTFSVHAHYDDKRLEPDGTLRVDRIGTGLILVSVNALAKLASTGKLRLDDTLRDGVPIYGFFDRNPPESGPVLGEDFAFCERWTRLCGGEIYAVIDEEIGHMDRTMHRGRFGDYIQQKVLA